jgi:hypothetical protein
VSFFGDGVAGYGPVMRHRFQVFAFTCLLLVACGGFPFDDSEPGYGSPSDPDPGYGPAPSPSVPPDPSTLPAPSGDPSASDDGANPHADASIDATMGNDSGDAGDASAPLAAWPPIDATVGDPNRVGCPEGSPRVGYLMSESGVLSRFDPATFTVTRVGIPSCPVIGLSYSPSSMSASRSGLLYVLFQSWGYPSASGPIYAIDPVSLECTLEVWTPTATELGLFSVAIAVQRTSAGEVLSVIGRGYDPDAPLAPETTTLARADLSTMTLSVVAKTPYVNYAPGALQADVYDRLFRVGYWGSIAQLDPMTAAVVAVDAMPGFVPSRGALTTAMVLGEHVVAFAPRATDFTVYDYDLVTKSTAPLVQLQGNVAVAAASPCSP